MSSSTPDVINTILGAKPGGKIAQLRGDRSNQIEEMQNYYLAVFEPDAVSEAALPARDRFLIAARVASHANSIDVAEWYARLADKCGVSAADIARARDVSNNWTEQSKLGAAIRHADLLVTRPSATGPADLQVLKDAGYSAAGIVSTSQVVAYVSYQLRLIAGLRAFGDAV